MPDTGAPWNIPYVESTDLVSDWPSDSLALANAIADGLDDAGNAGIGSNVVQTVKTDVFSTNSGSMTDITGFSVTITPSSASAKVLVVADMFLGAAGNTVRVKMVRDSTDIYTTASGYSRIYNRGTNDNKLGYSAPLVFLDSPATTSAVTYKVQIQAGTNTVYLNRSGGDTGTCASSITAIEVAA